MVIRRTDKVRELIRRDTGMIDDLAELAPALERLRNPEIRKVMAALLTVEEAAQMAGLNPEVVVARLNQESDAAQAERAPRPPHAPPPPDEDLRPAALSAIPEENIVHLDVREELRAGREPFSRIMAARREVPAGGGLCLRATFEPVPLFAVMGNQGFAHHVERLAADDWRVWFYPAGESGAAAAATTPSAGAAVPAKAAATTPEADVILLDVRGLEPPEPMVRTLEALETLPEGRTLVQLNMRVPEFLLPELEARGFSYEIREQSRDLVRVFIRRAAVPAAHASVPSTSDRPMPETKTLDVRVIPPREKHPTIFQTFAALHPGDSFVLMNDHDPLPLKYQFEYEHKGQFDWTYLEEGPAVWRVEIGKRAG